MTRGSIALAVIPPALWGFAYAVAKPATESFPPLFLAGLAYALAALVLFRPRQRLETPLWAVVSSATLGAGIQSALIFSGIAMVPASMATLVVQSQVPFAVIAAWAIGQERLNARRLTGIAVAIMGVAFIVGVPQSIGRVEGLLMIIGGTFSWGISQGIIRARGKDSGSRMMGAMSAIAAPQLLVLSTLLENGQMAAVHAADIFDWLSLAVLGFGGFAAAYSIWYSLLRRFRVDEVAPFILLMPIFGLLTAFMLLSEQPSLFVVGGAMVILLGIALVVIPARSPGAGTHG